MGSSGTFEKIFSAGHAPPVSQRELEEAIKTAHSVGPYPGYWGLRGGVSDLSQEVGLRAISCWLPTQLEMVYFVAFWNVNPDIYGYSKNASPAAVQTARLKREQVDIRHVLSVLASPSSSYLEKCRQVNRVQVALVEWCGSYDELCSGNMDYASFVRQYARSQWNRRSVRDVHADISSAPITPEEDLLFRDFCKNWRGLAGASWGCPSSLKNSLETLQKSFFETAR
jgi:hypothetical protein